MYEINDVVVYGTQGICRVNEIGPLEMATDKEKLYYTLSPLYQRGTVIYVPVDNQKSVMRSVISKEDIEELIEEIPEIEMIEARNDRERENLYKHSLRTCEPREIVKVIKTVYFRRKDRLASGKKRILVDEKYFQLAEDQLYSEMAYVMDCSKESIVTYISEKVKVH